MPLPFSRVYDTSCTEHPKRVGDAESCCYNSNMISALKTYARLIAVGAIVLVIGLGALGAKMYTDPQRVFNAMLRDSLASSSVTVQATQVSTGATAKQTIQYTLGAQNMSHALTTITQGKTVVVDETIGTQAADYTRYASITTDQKAKSGKPLDVSKVVGVWAKNDAHQIFSQTVLGTGLPIGGMVIPIGAISPEKRSSLLEQIAKDNVYNIVYKDVTHSTKGGRLQYTYDASVNPVGYVRLMRTFAQDIGIHDLDQLNPNSYASQQTLHVKLTVDAYSHHLVTAALTEGGTYTQSYSSYDIPVGISLPSRTISTTVLQQRLNAMQQ